jgi:hypothetical protein
MKRSGKRLRRREKKNALLQKNSSDFDAVLTAPHADMSFWCQDYFEVRAVRHQGSALGQNKRARKDLRASTKQVNKCLCTLPHSAKNSAHVSALLVRHLHAKQQRCSRAPHEQILCFLDYLFMYMCMCVCAESRRIRSRRTTHLRTPNFQVRQNKLAPSYMH